MAVQVGPPGLRVGMARVGRPFQFCRVALGRVGALDPPDREIGADQVTEALDPAQQAPLPLLGKERVGDRLRPVEGHGLPAGADQHVSPRVAQGEADHGLPSGSFGRVHPQLAAAPYREPRPAAAPARASACSARDAGRSRRRRSGRHDGRPGSPAWRASRRRPADHDQPQRPVEQPERKAEGPCRGEGADAREDPGLAAAEQPARRGGGERQKPGYRRRARAQGKDRDERRRGVGEPAQGYAAGHRQPVALHLVDPPLGAEDPLVGADRLGRRTHGRICLPISLAAFATWSGLKTSQPTRTAATKKSPSS